MGFVYRYGGDCQPAESSADRRTEYELDLYSESKLTPEADRGKAEASLAENSGLACAELRTLAALRSITTRKRSRVAYPCELTTSCRNPRMEGSRRAACTIHFFRAPAISTGLRSGKRSSG